MDNAPKTNMQLSLKLDYRILTLLLIAIIAAMLFIWKPWQDTISAASRTIRVSGESTLTATPDEFLFYPIYEFKNSDKQAALSELTKKSDEVTVKLKALGVASNKIKTNSGGYDLPVYGGGESTPAYTLSLTITLSNRELAQKVQDYLLTTTPTGSVSPQANFSDKKRKELESKARDAAAKEARTKADQSAKNLGFSLGSVKSVEDGAGFGLFPYATRSTADSATAAENTSQLEILPGENELNYSVTVTYFVK
jgi:uncharacterized protein YggE